MAVTSETRYPLHAAAGEFRHLGHEAVEVTRMRYSVRTGSGYGYGVEFDDVAEAVQAALAKIVWFDYTDPATGRQGHSRVWVEQRAKIRYADGSSVDTRIGQIEVFPVMA